ncbi:MAG: alpha/beta hydrolase family esterase [Fimbriimonas sp.]
MTLRLPSLLLVATWMSAGCTQPAPLVDVAALPQKAPGRYAYTIRSGGVDRTFAIRVPKAYDASRPLPLVVILHGWTMSGPLAETYTLMADTAEKEGFVLAAPDGLGSLKGWNAGFLDLSGKRADDVAFVSEVIEKTAKEVGIDRNRIYVAGHSNGAMLANLVGSRLADKIAAIGVVAGTIGLPQASGGTRTIPDPKNPLSVMLIHGRLDETVTYEPSRPGLLKGIGAPQSARWWAERIGALRAPVRDVGMDGRVVTETWKGGKNGAEVALVTIENGTHAWPGGFTNGGRETETGVDAAALLWRFFQAHPKKN